MAYDVVPAVEKTIVNLEALTDEDVDEAIDSYLRKFSIRDEDDLITIEAKYEKAGHERRKVVNREYTEIELEDMNYAEQESIKRALNIRSDAVETIVPLIRDRFSSFYENDIFSSMTWLDPQYWSNDNDYGHDAIETVIQNFKVPLEAAGFDKRKVFTEWRSLRITVRSFYSKESALMLWEKLFRYKREEYPNILKLVELVLCLSSSNCAVERVFSILTLLLSDRRLTMNHDTMEDSILIAGNSRFWTDMEREEILTKATEKYLMKRRRTKIASISQPGPSDSAEAVTDDQNEDEDDDSDDDYDFPPIVFSSDDDNSD